MNINCNPSNGLVSIVFVLIICLSTPLAISAQCPCNDPGGLSVCVEPIIGAEIGDIECVDFTTYGFTNIESGLFPIHYNTDVLRYVRCDLSNDHDLTSFCSILNNPNDENNDGIPDIKAVADSTGVLTALYFTFTGIPASITDGDVLFTLCFEVVGEPGINSAISVSDYNVSGNTQGIEFTQNNGDPNNPDDTIIITDFCTEPADVDVSCTAFGVYARGCGAPAGEASGTLTMYACGGTPPYSFTVNGNGVFGTYADFAEAIDQGLTPGSYTVVATDALNNTRSTILDLANSPLLSAALDVRNPSCPTSSLIDGRVTVLAEGGTGRYNYTWEITNDDGVELIQANLDVLNRLGNGTYRVSVTDESGCVAIAEETLFSAPISVNIETSREARCIGRTGAVLFNVLGGTPYPGGGYDIELTFPNGDVREFDNFNIRDPLSLTAGTYQYLISDNASITCTSEMGTFDLEIQKELSLLGEPMKVSCGNAADGSIQYTLNTEGGRAEVFDMYTLTDTLGTDIPNFVDIPVGDTEFAIEGLAGGVYILLGESEQGCEVRDTFEILETDSLEIFLSVSNPGCGDQTGAIIAQAEGGTGTYTFNWSDDDMITEAGRTDLSVGSYSIFAIDDLGCVSETKDTTLVTDGVLKVDDIIIQNTTCEGEENGFVTIRVNGDNGNGLYDWNDGNGFVNDPSYRNLSPQRYDVSIELGTCKLDTFAEVLPPAPFAYDISPTLPPCPNDNGSITIVNTDPDRSYSYTWIHPSNTDNATLTGVPAGMYSFIVSLEDDASCSIIDSFELENPPMITVDLPADMITPVTCNGDATGAAIASATGGAAGTGTYNYVWSSGEVGTANAIALTSGEQWVIADDGLCASDTLYFEVDQNEPIAIIPNSVVVVNPNCAQEANGSITVEATGGTGIFTYNWTNLGTTGAAQTDLLAGMYEIIITDDAGCTSEPDSIEVMDPPLLEVFIDSLLTQGIKCHGDTIGRVTVGQTGGSSDTYSYAWSDDLSDTNFISNVGAGIYAVTVTDINGCTQETMYEMTTPERLIAEIPQPSAPTCFNDQSCISVNAVSGGTGSLYTFSVNTGGTLWPIDTCINVFGGDHKIFVYDEIGCSIDTLINIPEQQELIVELGPDRNFDLGASNRLVASISALFPIDTIVWNTNIPLTCENDICSEVSLSPFDDMKIGVLVIDSQGCIAEDEVTISVDKARSIYIPNTFCPDDLNVSNRSFTMFTTNSVEAIPFIGIYDRFGNAIVTEDNVQLNPAGIEIWDGRMDNTILESGVYSYLIEVRYIDGTTLPFKGTVTLIK